MKWVGVVVEWSGVEWNDSGVERGGAVRSEVEWRGVESGGEEWMEWVHRVQPPLAAPQFESFEFESGPWVDGWIGWIWLRGAPPLNIPVVRRRGEGGKERQSAVVESLIDHV